MLGLRQLCRVGSAMGAGDAWQARNATLVAMSGGPVALLAASLLFLSPPGHRFILGIFSQAPSAALQDHVWGLSWLSVAFVLPSAVQLSSGGAFMVRHPVCDLLFGNLHLIAPAG